MRPASAAGTHKESVLTCGDNHKRDSATHALPDEDKVAAANPVGLDRVVDGGGHVSKPAIPSLFSFSPSPSPLLSPPFFSSQSLPSVWFSSTFALIELLDDHVRRDRHGFCGFGGLGVCFVGLFCGFATVTFTLSSNGSSKP